MRLLSGFSVTNKGSDEGFKEIFLDIARAFCYSNGGLMREKQFSFIIIPHSRGKQKTFTISKKAFKFLTVFIPLVFIVLTAFLVDYFAMNGTRQKYKSLKQENYEQKETLVQYQKSINDLEATIEEFEQYRTKLNIMAGLKSDEVLEEEPGVGGPGHDQDVNTSNPTPTPVQDLMRLDSISQKAAGIQDNLNTLTNFFEDQTITLAQTPSIMPTQGYISSSYKYRTDPFTGKWTFHPGMDIATQHGNPIIATADGLVISTKTDKMGGKTVKISHPKTGYVTVYCHLSKFLVKPGQRVKRGDTIGLIGRTGRARGPHVHYEVRLNNKRLNPWNFILDN